jgi:hypothetical protein
MLLISFGAATAFRNDHDDDDDDTTTYLIFSPQIVQFRGLADDTMNFSPIRTRIERV